MPETEDEHNYNSYKLYFIVTIDSHYDYLFYTQPKTINYLNFCMEDLDRKPTNLSGVKISECCGHFLDPNTEEVFVIFRGYFKVDYNAHTIKVYLKSKQGRLSGNKILNRVYTFSPDQSFRRNDRLKKEIVNDLESRQEMARHY